MCGGVLTGYKHHLPLYDKGNVLAAGFSQISQEGKMHLAKETMLTVLQFGMQLGVRCHILQQRDAFVFFFF